MTIKQLCHSLGMTQQAYHQWNHRRERATTPQADAEQVVQLVNKVRSEYLPGAGVRQVFNFIRSTPELRAQIVGWSKHRYERLCKEYGLIYPVKLTYRNCTRRGAFQFDNQLKGKELNSVNQAFATDIFYVFSNVTGRRIGYCTTLIDLYSRFLLGLSFSQTMEAKYTSYEVLKQCLGVRKPASLKGCIFHSDAGKQYIYKPLLDLINKLGMISSMATNCLENAYAESLNDILKNHMLHGLKINSIHQLMAKQEWLKKSYNYYRVHSGIGHMTPADFEQLIDSVPIDQRTLLKIYQHEE